MTFFNSLKKASVISFAISILATLFYSVSPIPSALDLAGRDLLFQIRHKLKPTPSHASQFLLVNIDDATVNLSRYKWPFPRSEFAKAVDELHSKGARVIGFDFVFQGEDQNAASDAALELSMKHAGNVIIASYVDENLNRVEGHGRFQEASSRSALVNKVKDGDSVVRRAPLVFNVKDEQGNQSSWESEIYFKWAGWEDPFFSENPREIVISDSKGQRLTVPSHAGAMDINYMVTADDLPRVSFKDLIDGKIGFEQIRGKIALIGLTALAFHDIHETPLRSMPGIAVNANTILTLMTGEFLYRIPNAVNWALTFLSCWLIIRVTDRYSILKSLAVVIGVSFVFLFVSFCFFWQNVILDLFVLTVIDILVFFFAVVNKQFQTALENIRLREESVRDPLTGFYTRRFLEVHLKMDVKKVLSGAQRGGSSSVDEVSVVMIDLDNFKLVNDSFGHQEGDRVLKVLGASIRESVRKTELVCRYGGDEFCVILPGTDLQSAVKFSEKLRNIVASNPDLSYTTQSGTKSFRVTGSFGVASIKGVKALSAENLLKAADRALYRAKTGGRNQVCSYDPEKDVLDAK